MRGGVGVGVAGGRKLNDQRTGFVETKLAGGIIGDGQRGGKGTLSMGGPTNRQRTLYPHRE